MIEDDPAPVALMPADAVDLRSRGDEEELSPLETIALRRNLAAMGQAQFAAPDKVTPVGLYARYSTGRQKQKSIERQVSIVAAYMRALGYAVYVLYDDPARSARSVHRPGLQRLLTDCRAGRVRIIMVEDFDRWSRELFDAVPLCEELIKLGVAFHSAGDMRALSKREVIEAALKAEADRDRRTLIMTMGRFQLASEGGAHSGEFYGYRYGPERGFLIPYPPEAEVIVSVFEMAAAGVSHRNIGRAMRRRGAPGPTPNCRWTHGTVANILGQIAYTGRLWYPFTKTVYDRQTNTTRKFLRHPDEMTRRHFERLRIVSDDMFEAVNARRRSHGTPNGTAPHFLSGKATCDCAGVEGQRFHMNRGQMSCGRFADGEVCPGRTHSVMTARVERAVYDAVGSRLRSLVGEEAFATVVERSMREAAARRRSERAEVEVEVARVRAGLARLLDDDIKGEYPADVLAAKRGNLKRQLAKAQERLEVLVELPEALGADERLRALSETLDELAGRPVFKARDAGEALVSKSLARLLDRVVVMREGRPDGTMRVRVQYDLFRFLHEGAHPGVGGAPETVEVDVEMNPGRHARHAAAAAALLRTDGHRLDDARWALVANLLPDVTSHRGDTRRVTTRAVVDALMLRLRTGMPVLSKASGDTLAMQRALSRFIYAAGDQILLDRLRVADPDFVASLDLRPVEAARRRWKVGGEDLAACRSPAARMHALDGRTALDDDQWAASAPLIHPGVEISLKGARGPANRTLLEAVILALRSGRSWQRLPPRFGDGREVCNAVRRLVRGGSWDRLVEMWSARYPDLVDGLDIGRLAKMRRGSAAWRGPSPKRSRYARNGGLARPRRRQRAGTAPVRRTG